MNDPIVEQLNDLHFDGTWEALIPLLEGMFDRAEARIADDYHTTGVLTILTTFLAVCERFGCDPNEHPKLKKRSDDIAKRVLEWFEQNRIPVHFVARTSMGGLVGALYSMGASPAEMRQIIKDQNPGAPAGNQKARKHGLYCAEMREAVGYVRAMARQARELSEAE